MSSSTKTPVAASELIAPEAEEAAASGDMNEAAENADLERIRELLFGGHVDDVGRRFARIEEQIAALNSRFDAIESRLDNEAHLQGGALEEEQRERARVIAALDDDLKKRARELNKELQAQTSTLRGDVAAALTGIAAQLVGETETKRRSDG